MALVPCEEDVLMSAREVNGEYGFRSEARSEAGDRSGRWRRIVLGDVLAEHVVELRERER